MRDIASARVQVGHNRQSKESLVLDLELDREHGAVQRVAQGRVQVGTPVQEKA